MHGGVKWCTDLNNNRPVRFRNLLSILGGGEQTPDPQDFADRPGLGVTAPGKMGQIAVQDLRDMAQAAGLHLFDGGSQPGQRRRPSCRPVDPKPGFAVGRKDPGPGRAVVVGGLASGVFVARVAAPVGVLRIAQQLAVIGLL